MMDTKALGAGARGSGLGSGGSEPGLGSCCGRRLWRGAGSLEAERTMHIALGVTPKSLPISRYRILGLARRIALISARSPSVRATLRKVRATGPAD